LAAQIVAIDVTRESYDQIGSPVIEKAGVAHKIDFRVGLALPVMMLAAAILACRKGTRTGSTSPSWTRTR
jgi:hypothetical protein